MSIIVSAKTIKQSQATPPREGHLYQVAKSVFELSKQRSVHEEISKIRRDLYIEMGDERLWRTIQQTISSVFCARHNLRIEALPRRTTWEKGWTYYRLVPRN